MICAFFDDVRGFERYLAELRKVTPEDIARVTRTYLVPTRRNIVTLSPPKADAAPAPAAKKQVKK